MTQESQIAAYRRNQRTQYSKEWRDKRPARESKFVRDMRARIEGEIRVIGKV